MLVGVRGLKAAIRAALRLLFGAPEIVFLLFSGLPLDPSMRWTLSLLTMLPKLILWHAPSNTETNPKVKSRLIAERIRLALAGQWTQLYGEALAAANWEVAQPLPAVGQNF